jgi:hypothetical protein
MSYESIPGIDHWIKMKPNPGTNRVAPNIATSNMISQGYEHYDKFTSVSYKPNTEIITIGKGGTFLSLQDKNGKIITINASAHTLNLLFTINLNYSSAREQGINEEKRFINSLRETTPFIGRDILTNLCGEWTSDDIQEGKPIKRPIIITENNISICLGIVPDVCLKSYNISYKSGPEVRLISSGIRGKLGFCDSPSSQEDIYRNRLLKSIGIPTDKYNEFFGYTNVEVDQVFCADQLIEQAYGLCIYFHQLNSSNVIVKDYTTNRPSVQITSDGIIRGFDKIGNKNVEIAYQAIIDERPVIVTFMIRVDNKAYSRPNILQIKVRYLNG